MNDMTDVLAGHGLLSHGRTGTYACSNPDCGWQFRYRVRMDDLKRGVDVVAHEFAAGYSKPRTITTAEELDALPVGSVVRSGRDVIYEKANFHGDPEFPFWLSPGVNLEFASMVVTLPATVLHEAAS